MKVLNTDLTSDKKGDDRMGWLRTIVSKEPKEHGRLPPV